MKFYCTYCGQHIDARDDLAGTKSICPSCGNEIAVPRIRLSDVQELVPDSPDANLTIASNGPNLDITSSKVAAKTGIRIPIWWLIVMALYLYLMISMMMEGREARTRLISMEEAVNSWSNFEQLTKNWSIGLMRGLEGTFYYSASVLAIPGPVLILGILIHISSKDYAALRGLFLGTAIIMGLHPLLEYLIGPL